MDVSNGQAVDGPIDRCRYSPVAWLPGGKAFYYVRRMPPDEVPPDEYQYHRRVYLHQVGTAPEQDVMIFGAGMEKTNYYGVSVSWDGHWLMVTASRGTAPRNDLWLADLTSSDPAAPEFAVVQEGLDAQTSVYAGRDGRLYMFTDYGAPRGRLAVADPADPGPDSWRDLISEDPEAVLSDYRDSGRPRARRAGAARQVDPPRGQRDHRARPGDRRTNRPGAGTRPGFGKRDQRAPGGRPRGMVRLYRSHQPDRCVQV